MDEIILGRKLFVYKSFRKRSCTAINGEHKREAVKILNQKKRVTHGTTGEEEEF